jgi:hypothetical protein
MVKVFQHLLSTLQRKDQDRQSRGLPARYWVLDDIDAFVQEFRARAFELSKVPWATYDFTTMYEGLSHTSLITVWGMAAEEAWKYEEEVRGEGPLLLGASGWYRKSGISGDSSQLWLSIDKFLDCNMHLLSNLYTLNGDCFRRQVKGLPMGLECSPQMANLYGYAIEAQWVDSKQPNIVLVKRYIDDIFVAGADAPNPGSGIPSEDDYAMKYKLTSEAPDSLLYLGVRFFKDEKGEAHCALHDRAVDYPIQLDRYPHASTVANPTQLGGVIMGRLVAAQRTCSRMDLFQDAVAGIFTHAYRRNYARRLVHGVWTQFLLRYWDAAGNPTKELRDWFHRTWKAIVEAEGHEAPPGRPLTESSANMPQTQTTRTWTRTPASSALMECPPHDDARGSSTTENNAHAEPPPHEEAEGGNATPSNVRVEPIPHDEEEGSNARARISQPDPRPQSSDEGVPPNVSQDSTFQLLLGMPDAGEQVAHMDVDTEDSTQLSQSLEGALVPYQGGQTETGQHGAYQMIQRFAEDIRNRMDASQDWWLTLATRLLASATPNVVVNQQCMQVVPVDRPVPIYIPVPMPVEQRIPFPVYVPFPNQPAQYAWNQYLHMQQLSAEPGLPSPHGHLLLEAAAAREQDSTDVARRLDVHLLEAAPPREQDPIGAISPQ